MVIGPRRTPRAARTLLITLLTAWLAAGIGLAGPTPARADEAQAYVTVSIGSLAPAVPTPSDTVVITGTVTNTSQNELSKLQALMWRNQAPITDAEQMAAAVSSTPEDPLGSRIATLGTWQQLTRSNDPATVDLPTSLAPGQSLPFTVRASMTQFEFPGTPGVYLVGVQLRGTTDGLDGADLTLGRARTFLPVGVSSTDTDTDQTVPVSSIVVLSAAPTLLSPGTAATSTTAAVPARFADDTLADRLAEGGDLDRLLALSAQTGYSILVDPALVEAARQLTTAYAVRQSDGTFADRPARAAAQAWLTGLAAVSDDRLFQLPYGNPDIAALVHSGHEDLYRPDLGADILPGVPTIALPAGGQADAGTLRLAGQGTVAAVLLARDATGSSAPVLTSPEVDVPVVTFDQAALDGGPGPDPSTTPTQIRQRYLADTLLQSRESDPAAVVRLITNASQAKAVPSVTAPWLAAVPLASLLASTPQTWDDEPSYPSSARKAELSRRTVNAAAQLADDYAIYAALQVNPDRTDTAAPSAVARATSVHWRGDPGRAARYLAPQQAALDQILDGGVRIDRIRKILTTGESADAGFSIINDTDIPVRVNVVFTSANPQRLTVDTIVDKTVPAHTRLPMRAAFTVHANGDVPVVAQLTTVDDQVIGPKVDFIVSATQYGMVGVLIAVAAAVVLFVSTGLRIRQVRRESASRTAASEVDGLIDTRGPKPAPPAADVPDVPDQSETPPEGLGSAEPDGDHAGADRRG